MKKFKKIARRSLAIIVIALVLAVWLYSGFKILNYLKLTEILGKSVPVAGAFLGEPPEPPDPPEPPCPPTCCSTPTPTPLIEPTLTPTPELPTPTPTSMAITPTSPPSAGGSSEGGGASGLGGPSVCGAVTPLSPSLLNAQKISSDQVKLDWTAVDPATHYAVVYGLFSGNYLYGVADTGKTTSFTVGGLDAAAKYCFAVRAVNGCAPGGLSNEICQGTVGGGRVLGASTLGATGSTGDQLFQILYIIGCVCVAFGLRLYGVAKKPAWL